LRDAEAELKKVRLEKDNADSLLKTLEGNQLVLEGRMEVEEGSEKRGADSAGAESMSEQDVVMYEEKGGESVVQQENGKSVIEPDIDAPKQLIPVDHDVTMANAQSTDEVDGDAQMHLITEDQKNQLLGSVPNGCKSGDTESDEQEDEAINGKQDEDIKGKKKEKAVNVGKCHKSARKFPL
jgi:hypothetical protein